MFHSNQIEGERNEIRKSDETFNRINVNSLLKNVEITTRIRGSSPSTALKSARESENNLRSQLAIRAHVVLLLLFLFVNNSTIHFVSKFVSLSLFTIFSSTQIHTHVKS
jgi:hypothetical protein